MTDHTEADLRAIAAEWMTLWSGAGLDAFDRLHHADFVDHGAGDRAPTREAFAGSIEALYRAFPDFRATAEALVVDRGARTVAVRWTAIGTHRGAFLGVAPTGARIQFAGIEIIEVRDGQIVARWGEWDGLGLRAQLEAARGD